MPLRYLSFLVLFGVSSSVWAQMPDCEATDKCFTNFVDFCENEAPYEKHHKFTVDFLHKQLKSNKDCTILAENLFASDTLALESDSLVSVTPLKFLTHLKSLSLAGREILDLRPLVSLTNLRVLSLRLSAIQKYDFLAGLTQLKSLQLYFTPVDPGYFQKKPGIEHLKLHAREDFDVEVLAGLPHLRALYFYSEGSPVNIESLAKLGQLQALKFVLNVTEYGKDSVEVSSVKYRKRNWSFIGQLSKLKVLELSQIPFSDARLFADLKDLKALSLNFDYTSITTPTDFAKFKDLRQLEAAKDLEFLQIPKHDITEIFPLWEKKYLKYVDLGLKTEITSWGAVTKLPRIQELVHLGYADPKACPFGQKDTGVCVQSVDLKPLVDVWTALGWPKFR
jgi:hypothetical protein